MGIATRIISNRGVAEISPGFSVFGFVKLETDEEEDLPYLVTLDIEFQSGRFVCTSLNCKQRSDGEPVTSEGIRAIPVAQLIRRGLGGNPFAVMRFKKRKDSVEMTPLDVPRDITGQGPTDEALQYVALAYRFAYALGEAPTKGVMERLRLNRSTAGKWVMLSRERGYLSPTTPGKAGEEI